MSEFFDFIPEYTTKVYKFASHEPADAISVLNPRLQTLCNNIAYLLQFIQTLDVESRKDITGLEKDIAELETETNQLYSRISRLIQEHNNNFNNPHTVTKTQIGLGNVDNTSDENKPISTATQTALNGKADSSHIHAATDVTQDSSHRFVTDSEKSTWNGKANASHGAHVSYSSTAPKMDGTASAGSASTVARSDHVHPTDTSRASASHTHSYLPLSGGTLTGDLRIKGSGNYGTKINLGDGDYVHLSEPSDDNLEIKAKNINMVTTNGLTNNGTAVSLNGHTHTKSQITNFPTSLPASDVYSWAKASAKPSYTWSEIKNKPSSFTPASHTHNYSSITSGTGSDYTTYRVRDIALLSYTPSYLGNGQIALVYT